MSKTNNTLFFVSLGAVIVGILIMLKQGCCHKGLLENTSKNIDNRLKDLAAALDKATQFVQQALNHTS